MLITNLIFIIVGIAWVYVAMLLWGLLLDD